MIQTSLGPLALEELEMHKESEDLPQGNRCVTIRYYFAGELVRQDIKIIVSAECMAAMGLQGD